MNAAITPSTDTPVQLLTVLETYNLEFLVEHYGGFYWRPRLKENEFRVGYTCITSDQVPTKENLQGLSSAPIVVSDVPAVANNSDLKMLAKPEGWTRIFPPSPSTPGKGDLCIYRPIAPANYVALSDVAIAYSEGSDKIPDPQFRCVHKALLQFSEFTPKEIWKGNESTWNIKNSGFFIWNGEEKYPTYQPYLLSAGSILSNLKITEIAVHPKEDKVKWIPKHIYSNNYVNKSDVESTHTFSLSASKSRTVTTTWDKSTATELGLKFGVKLTLATEANGLLAKQSIAFETTFENSITNTLETSVGGGTNDLTEESFSQECTVKVAPHGNVKVSASIFTASYAISYSGELTLDNKTPGSQPIILKVKGTFDYSVDTDESWWEISEGGEFLTKEKI